MASANYGNPHPDTPLLRGGSSLYSLTFEEFQNVLGEPGANLGSMNMDELLRNIWTAEESQAMAAAMNPLEGLNGGLSSQFSLQKQASLSLPRTLSGRTVEDVWKTFQPQQGSAAAVAGGANHQRQPTLGEVTLEDFLVKAGIVRERPPLSQTPFQALRPPASSSFNHVHQSPTIHALAPSNQVHQMPNIQTLGPSNQMHQAPTIHILGSNQVHQAPPIPSSQVQQQVPPNHAFMGFGGNTGFSFPRNDGGNHRVENGNRQATPPALNKFIPTAANILSCPPSSDRGRFDALDSMSLQGQHGDSMSNGYGKPFTHQNQQGQQLVQRHAIAEAASAPGSVSNASNGPFRESSPGRLSPLGGGLGAVLGTGGLGMNLGGNPCPSRISFGAASPLSPVFDEGSPETRNLPFSLITEFGNGQQQQRRKRCAEAPVERVIERRQRRMIKNRESAARSRARKQAYTVELEAEVSQLKEENLTLLRKQEEEAAKRKKQILALMPATVVKTGYKGWSLKRTHTGPW